MELKDFIDKVAESNKDSGMIFETLTISLIVEDEKIIVCQQGKDGCAQVRMVPSN